MTHKNESHSYVFVVKSWHTNGSWHTYEWDMTHENESRYSYECATHTMVQLSRNSQVFCISNTNWRHAPKKKKRINKYQVYTDDIVNFNRQQRGTFDMKVKHELETRSEKKYRKTNTYKLYTDNIVNFNRQQRAQRGTFDMKVKHEQETRSKKKLLLTLFRFLLHSLTSTLTAQFKIVCCGVATITRLL